MPPTDGDRLGTENPQEWNQDPSEAGRDFGACKLYGCPNCMVLVWIAPSAEDEECPACGYPGEFDTIHLVTDGDD